MDARTSPIFFSNCYTAPNDSTHLTPYCFEVIRDFFKGDSFTDVLSAWCYHPLCGLLATTTKPPKYFALRLFRGSFRASPPSDF